MLPPPDGAQRERPANDQATAAHGVEELPPMLHPPTWIGPFGSEGWVADPDMDEHSKALIEHMLLEEQLMYGGMPAHVAATGAGAHPVHDPRPSANADPAARDAAGAADAGTDGREAAPALRAAAATKAPQSSLVAAGSAAQTLSVNRKKPLLHNVPWSAEEVAHFEEAVARVGQRSWKRVAELLGTRTPLQVKNFARHYYRKRQQMAESEADVSDSAAAAVSMAPKQEPAVTVGDMTNDEDVDVDVLSDRDPSDTGVAIGAATEAVPVPDTQHRDPGPSSGTMANDPVSEPDSMSASSASTSTSDSCSDDDQASEASVEASPVAPSLSAPLPSSAEDTIEQQEFTLGAVPTDLERRRCAEFFQGHANKTPERYVRVPSQPAVPQCARAGAC